MRLVPGLCYFTGLRGLRSGYHSGPPDPGTYDRSLHPPTRDFGPPDIAKAMKVRERWLQTPAGQRYLKAGLV